MVRISTRPFLHLLPKLVGAKFDYPFYARVTQVDQTNVSFRGLEGGDGTVSREITNRCRVTAREVNPSGHLSHLRRPVALKIEGQVHFGQIRVVDGDRVTVVSDGDRFSTSTAHTSLVPHIVALLLEHVKFPCEVWSDNEILVIQSTILDRVTGRNDEASSNDIAKIFEGLISHESCPSPAQRCD
ncbi:unnamed protein product [Phytophthora fragariaefolia]|uniref:Unnamed protein product n=1 Tax=Phytophthora fragariaefolia TaxID=1490495 RepID=A0A9W6Y2A2_9STRA|nr:unnamed protein product [Phytophthora fragariaefolia]